MKKNEPAVLIVDDDEKIVFAFLGLFKGEGFRCMVAHDGEEAVEKVASEAPQIVFMDITMPRLDGLEALRRIKEINPSIPVILITGVGTMQTAIKAIQLGAFDYLTKPLDVAKVRASARKAMASINARPSDGGQAVPHSAQGSDRYEIIGNSSLMQEVYKLIGSISVTPNHTSVLIQGESGTGKELVARAIHANGKFAAEPFIAINCTALPEALLESELFGHEKGAFTGAVERKLGKFELAGQGSIFLDEIGNLSLQLQQKLLRVLQEREFERVGGNVPLKVDARFIAATNLQLEEGLRNRTFREDLFFRLNVAKVQLPPLRDRREDIPLLANYFLRKYNERHKSSIKGFSEEAYQFLLGYHYPGNVRELENMIERAVMLTKGDVIMADTLGETHTASAGSGEWAAPSGQPFSVARNHALELFEREYVTAMLREHQGNVSAAANASGMTRQNFQRLMVKHGISASEYRPPRASIK